MFVLIKGKWYIVKIIYDIVPWTCNLSNYEVFDFIIHTKEHYITISKKVSHHMQYEWQYYSTKPNTVSDIV
jgi:hypothetical protein